MGIDTTLKDVNLLPNPYILQQNLTKEDNNSLQKVTPDNCHFMPFHIRVRVLFMASNWLPLFS